MNLHQILAWMRAGVAPALGCTEPGAVALAAAYAQQALGTQLADKFVISVDANVYKNGVAVGIPGTGRSGMAIAAAMGAVIAEPAQQLSMLSCCTPAVLVQAETLLAEGKIEIVLNDHQGLYIAVDAYGGDNHARAVLAQRHTNLVCLEYNGRSLLDGSQLVMADGYMLSQSTAVTDLAAIAEQLPVAELKFLAVGIEMNLAAAKVGLQRRLGMAVGAHLQDLMDQQLMADDVVGYAKVLTAAGADARMSGEAIPVMSVAGSGNHGLTAILPVVAVAERYQLSQEQLQRAVALSALVTMYVKQYTGGLSALCGCAVAAATGAGAAIVWLLGGTEQQIGNSIKNMVANLTGMICDGGKVGCALKLATAAGVAVETALLTLKGVVVPDTNGIILASPDDTIRNLGKVSNPGMLITDKVILEIMLAKGQ